MERFFALVERVWAPAIHRPADLLVVVRFAFGAQWAEKEADVDSIGKHMTNDPEGVLLVRTLLDVAAIIRLRGGRATSWLMMRDLLVRCRDSAREELDRRHAEQQSAKS